MVRFLNAGLQLTLSDHRLKNTKNQTFVHAGGISEYADFLVKGKTPLHAVLGPSIKDMTAKTIRAERANRGDAGGFMARGIVDSIEVECALRWSCDQYTDTLVSFANDIRTADGGTHVDGLRSTLARGINAAKRSANTKKTGTSSDDYIPGEYVREGLTAVLLVPCAASCQLDFVQFSHNVLLMLAQLPNFLPQAYLEFQLCVRRR